MKSLKIGIVSDSHGRLAALETMAARNPAVDVWFHCGDYCEDAEALALCTTAPVYTVLGNNDYYRGAEAPEELWADVGGICVYMTHGHQWPAPRRPDKLAERALTRGAVLALFGHTHRRFEGRTGGCTVINPGSISLPRDGKRGTYGICTLRNGTIEAVRFYETE